ncbi:hypothetical protein EYC80_007624 [Monilinia laxa]|uniref:Microbial-type PARG catalytic domain-containing protein n=1 Tax=Monilinia laxa TaxID=61186 RepID=A0A5N6JWJ7_MONLA|nr:hypothetical protein EYC80_007624 [Monilinia laxa]
MPPSKPKPSEIAAEAKKTYIPYIRSACPQWPTTSYLCHSDSLRDQQITESRQYTFAFLERDPVDLALEWAASENNQPIPVIMPAHERRPGGDWEAGVMQPEECLARRSTLYACLTTPASDNITTNNYPVPERAGIISQNVVVFRNGPEKYEPWSEYKSLPIISVPTVKRPKLDSSGKRYSFKTERELMKASIKTALRIAIFYSYDKIVIGTYGLGPGFKNPPEEVANIWRELLVRDNEFNQQFSAIIFAFEPCEGAGGSNSSSPSSSSKNSKSSSSSSKTSFTHELEIFRQTFKPANLHGAFKS